MKRGGKEGGSIRASISRLDVENVDLGRDTVLARDGGAKKVDREAWNNAATALVDSQFSSTGSRLRRGEHASNRLLLGAEIGHLPKRDWRFCAALARLVSSSSSSSVLLSSTCTDDDPGGRGRGITVRGATGPPSSFDRVEEERSRIRDPLLGYIIERIFNFYLSFSLRRDNRSFSFIYFILNSMFPVWIESTVKVWETWYN